MIKFSDLIFKFSKTVWPNYWYSLPWKHFIQPLPVWDARFSSPRIFIFWTFWLSAWFYSVSRHIPQWQFPTIYMYTLSVKRNLYINHFFRATLTKIRLIKINNICSQMSCKNIWKNKALLVSKRRKMRWNRKKVIFKHRRNCPLSKLHGGSLFRTFNSYMYLSNFNGGLYNRCTGFYLWRTPQSEKGVVSVIFEKWPLVISLLFPLFWLKQTFFFFFSFWCA